MLTPKAKPTTPTMESTHPICAGLTPNRACKTGKVNEILANCMAAKMPHTHNRKTRCQWVVEDVLMGAGECIGVA